MSSTIRLRDIGSTYGGLTGKTKADFSCGDASFVTFLEVINSTRLRGHALERVRVTEGERQNRVMRGDLLFNGSSETPEEVALSSVVDFDPDTFTFLNSFCFGFRLRADAQVDPTYLAYFFRSSSGRALVASLAQGATRYNIAKTKFLDVELALPSIAHQREIAQSLGHADDLIATLERLIAKKQSIKQGMMQQLLTGRTRLPGFDGSLVPRRLSDVAVKIQDGTHFSPKLGGSEYAYITSRNIGSGVMKLDSIEMISSVEHRKIYNRADTKFGDILLTKDGANTGNAALNPFREEISLLSSVAFIRCDPRAAVAGYVLQYILSHDGRKQIEDAMAGNAITRLTLEKIRNLIVPLPCVDEQRAVAKVLGDADTEISKLRDRLTKARDVKIGMMQQLLTGRTRLPVESDG